MSPAEIAERVRARLFRRRDAYCAVFGSKGEYAPQSLTVLTDLARFCHARTPTVKVSRITGSVDPYASAVAEGRREVFNRICSQLNLTNDQIDRIASNRED